MSTEGYLSDVARLSSRLRELEIGIEPLRPASVGVYIVDLHIGSSDLRAVGAINNAFQLAFDAAIDTVAGPGAHALTDPHIRLTLISGGAGSWREVFILNPRTSFGREQLNYIVGLAIQALPLIDGLSPAVGVALWATFAGSMMVASAHVPDSRRVRADSVDADALEGVEVEANLYPPGRAWSPSASVGPDRSQRDLEDRFAQLGKSLEENEAFVHFTTALRSDSAYDIALIVDGGYGHLGKAEAVAQWFARESEIPFYRNIPDQ